MGKVILIVCIVTLLVTAFAVTANAYGEITYQDGIYLYTVSKGKATIVNTDRAPEGDITIPSTLGGYTVVGIGNGAFKDEDRITSVVIPDTITTMGVDAFQGCMYLESVTLPKNLTKISEDAFYYCPNLNNVVIPDSVTEIGDYAFAGCWQLTDITFGSNVTTLGDMAFYDCKGLTSIAIPDTITSFGYQMFGYCDNLREVKLPANITEIPMETFTQCFSLTDVTMPKKITSIGYSAFNSCEVLKKIEIPATVNTIYDGAFNYCEGLKFVYYGGSKAQWEKITIGDGNEYLKNATVFYDGKGPVPSEFAVKSTTRCTASIDNTAKTLDIVHSGGNKSVYVAINVDTAAGDVMTVSDVKGGTVTVQSGKILYIVPNNNNVSFKVTITDANGVATVFDAYASFGYPNFTFDSSMVAGVTRCDVTVDGTTINVVSNTGSKVSNMSFQFKLPEGATAAFAEGADTTYVSFTTAKDVKVVNPGVGEVTVPMVLTDSEGVSMEVTLKANFMNAIKNRTNASVAQSANNITLTGGSVTMYAYFKKMGIDGAHIEVVNPSRNMLDRYKVLGDMDVRFYHPTYNDGTVTINLLDANDEVVVSYNVTIKFNTKAYAPITAETLRATYTVEGDTITLTANAGVSNVYMVIGKYWAEKLSVSGADENLVQRLTGVGWRIYRTDAPVEFDVIFDASAEGGEVLTRHVVVNF